MGKMTGAGHGARQAWPFSWNPGINGSSWMLSGPSRRPPPIPGQISLEAGHQGVLVFSITNWARQQGDGSVVPRDPCKEIESQREGTKEAYGQTRQGRWPRRQV